jgi:hypothetical protein
MGIDELLTTQTIKRLGFPLKPNLTLQLSGKVAAAYFGHVGNGLNIVVLELGKTNFKYYVYHQFGPPLQDISEEERKNIVRNLYKYEKNRRTVQENFLEIAVQSEIDQYS